MLLEGTALQRGPQLSVVVVVHTQQVQKGFSRFLYTRITTIYWTIGMLLSFYYYVLLPVASFSLAAFIRDLLVLVLLPDASIAQSDHIYIFSTASNSGTSCSTQTQVSDTNFPLFCQTRQILFSFSRRKNCILFCRLSTTLTTLYIHMLKTSGQTQSTFFVSFEKGQ